MITLERTKKAGFTIIESLVSITILVIVITGVTSAVQTGISSYIFSKDQIIAFYLAQEGFEQIRNIRDENSLRNLSWLAGISEISSDPCFFGSVCRVNPVFEHDATRCTGPVAARCEVLRQDPVSGFFGYDSTWPVTPFRREITITQVNANEVSVSVSVYWSKGTTDRQFVAKENLLNWQ